ncbi:transcriptional regulator [Saccharothrix luteola]|uniref:transcriptional regulator n=1 Tax=Saccharothrix luteola TaxID=2893018 RepID=UPI001E304CF5|nr:transcriptional regulator [Saccharothrix luteola]MCC8245056.1 transcriptional regulator [Saccharothrix luteola]
MSTYNVALRTDAFSKAVRLAGFRSDYKLAKAMGLNRSTVTRVMSGDLRPGPAFIAGALVVLPPMVFEDLFDVITNPDRSESA